MAMDIFDTTGIPESYKKHLPPETLDAQTEAGKMMAEPFVKISQKVKDSLSRIYRVAAQPMGGDEVVKPLPAETNPIEYYGALAARIIALPLVAMKEIYDIGTSARTGAPKLRGGPAGEGDWTPEQYKAAAEATFTAGAAIGGGTPGGGRGPANIGRKFGSKELRNLTAKEVFESPAGKIKYDGWQEGFKEGTGWHTYTMQEGPAKGASFSAPTQKLDDVTKAAKAVTENFAKAENVAAREVGEEFRGPGGKARAEWSMAIDKLRLQQQKLR